MMLPDLEGLARAIEGAVAHVAGLGDVIDGYYDTVIAGEDGDDYEAATADALEDAKKRVRAAGLELEKVLNGVAFAYGVRELKRQGAIAR